MFTARYEMNINSLKPSGHYMYHQLNTHKFYILPTHTHTHTHCPNDVTTFCERPITILSAINPSKYSNFGITTTAISIFRNAIRQNKSHLTRRINIPYATWRRSQRARSGCAESVINRCYQRAERSCR